MHPNPAFHWQDKAAMQAFVRECAFGTLFLTTPEGPRAAHMPLLGLDGERFGFHLARGNALTPHLDGAQALVVVQGPDAYVSPDWYDLDDQVPTWNYVAVEMEGPVARMDDAALLALVDDLSTEHERRLAPKPAWTRDKMSPGTAEKMMRGIVGFTLTVGEWRGTRKLGQNKPKAARLSVARALEAMGDTTMSRWVLEA